MAEKLEVHEANEADVFRDTARIHHTKRGSIKAGSVVKMTVNGTHCWLAARGLNVNGDNEKNWIRLDDYARERLGNLVVGSSYDFQIEPATIWGQLRWAMAASDPSARVSIGIAIWSAVLGIALGIVGLVLPLMLR